MYFFFNIHFFVNLIDRTRSNFSTNFFLFGYKKLSNSEERKNITLLVKFHFQLYQNIVRPSSSSFFLLAEPLRGRAKRRRIDRSTFRAHPFENVAPFTARGGLGRARSSSVGEQGSGWGSAVPFNGGLARF